MSNPVSGLLGEKDSPNYKLYIQFHETFLNSHKFLRGRILTILDATFTDREQRKAVKDLVSQELDTQFREYDRQFIIDIFRKLTKGTKDELFQG